MKLKSLLAVALVAGASSAMASDFYVTGSVGQSSVSIDKGRADAAIGAGVTSTTDEDDTGYKLAAGWQFHKNFALELGYFDLGKAKYSATIAGGAATQEWKADGWGIGIAGNLPLGEQFSLIGRIAAVDAKVKSSCSATGTLVCLSNNYDHTDWTGQYTIGAQWNFTKQLGVRAEYDRFDRIGGGAIGKYDVDLWSVGLVVNF